ncbi:MAG: helix-turn-helix transcriptional regulator [Hoeflea sp.]|uniref:helix-turn-helix domain-containing protein n=1 Tax=Hoeflea sp. TaxID=1940281 RepID=UPI0032EC1C85
MGEIQKLTIDGKNYVLVSEEDYEDLIDSLEAQAIMARVAAGEETFPHELVVELSQTDSRIRTYRKYRGMTGSELAAAAGISQPHLSDIENGKKAGSVDVLKRIATALRVDLDDLVV